MIVMPPSPPVSAGRTSVFALFWPPDFGVCSNVPTKPQATVIIPRWSDNQCQPTDKLVYNPLLFFVRDNVSPTLLITF